eukprot:5153488-Pleurochrysis_carterae.AAC.3
MPPTMRHSGASVGPGSCCWHHSRGAQRRQPGRAGLDAPVEHSLCERRRGRSRWPADRHELLEVSAEVSPAELEREVFGPLGAQ